MAAKHLKILKSAHKGATSLILKTIKSTPADALESDLSVLPVDLRSEELQRYEVVKLLIKQDDYIQSSMVGRNRVYKMGSPFENIKSLTKHFAIFIADQKMVMSTNYFFQRKLQPPLRYFTYQTYG